MDPRQTGQTCCLEKSYLYIVLWHHLRASDIEQEVSQLLGLHRSDYGAEHMESPQVFCSHHSFIFSNDACRDCCCSWSQFNIHNCHLLHSQLGEEQGSKFFWNPLPHPPNEFGWPLHQHLARNCEEILIQCAVCWSSL